MKHQLVKNICQSNNCTSLQTISQRKIMATRCLIASSSIILLLAATSAAIMQSSTQPGIVSVLGEGFRSENHNVDNTLPLASAVLSSSESSCDDTYGFIPCSTTWAGNLFLMLVYGYFMYTAATYLYNGCELLLEIVGPGIVGGLLIPVLGALPDSILILVSGLFGSTESAQSQVSVGMGLLAGSTVMILTTIWGSCIIVGKCDLQGSRAVDGADTKGFSLTGSGVSTDIWTSYAAMIMGVSVISFIVVQVPQALDSSSGRRLAVLIALILSFGLLISYCVYQICQPWIQERHLSYVKRKRLISGFLGRLRKHTLGRLIHEDGRLNHHAVERLFTAIDVDGDNYLVKAELRAFLIGTQLDEMMLDEDDLVEKVMEEFDVEHADSKISLNEFKAGISKWLDDLRQDRPEFGEANMMKFLVDVHQESIRQHALLGGEGDMMDGEGEDGDETSKKPTIRAVLMLIIGTVIAAVFADPLVDAVDNFSDATGIPSFFISFIVLPLATNSSVAMSAIIFSSRKKTKTASLTFSELYGAVTMNNVLCLPVFLALVYFRGLEWDFSSEVLIILVVCVIIGLMGCLRTTFPLWTSLVAYALYPLSLVLVFILDYICGWS